MSHKVLIAGAGQLGSRYLQGLSQVTETLEIYVFDPEPDSLARAEIRWNEMHITVAHKVLYTTSLLELPHAMDLAIVSTTADVRVALVDEIANRFNVSYWLLEKVLGQSGDEINLLQRTLEGKIVWVNTPMYMWPLYSKLRDVYPAKTPIAATFEGFRGLACNAIHYVDFVSRWNGVQATHIDVSGLEVEWYKGKRDGFYEIDGEIKVAFADGSNLALRSNRDNLHYKVELRVDDDIWQVSEYNGIAKTTNGRIIKGGIYLQTQLTTILVQSIFANLSCGLPTLSQSAKQHTVFLNALLEHWNKHMPNKVKRIPIT